MHSGDTVYKALRRMADDGILTWAEGTFRLTVTFSDRWPTAETY